MCSLRDLEISPIFLLSNNASSFLLVGDESPPDPARFATDSMKNVSINKFRNVRIRYALVFDFHPIFQQDESQNLGKSYLPSVFMIFRRGLPVLSSCTMTA